METSHKIDWRVPQEFQKFLYDGGLFSGRGTQIRPYSCLNANGYPIQTKLKILFLSVVFLLLIFHFQNGQIIFLFNSYFYCVYKIYKHPFQIFKQMNTDDYI